jgi:hypothetical protein
VFREARHLGTAGDAEAKLKVADPEMARAMGSIARWRQTLKTTYFFEQIAEAWSVAAIREPYERATLLAMDSLPALFDRAGWASNYGGPPWRQIAEMALALGNALDAGDGTFAEATCDEVATLRHNTDRLVPPTAGDQLREKWPRLCDGRAAQ